MGKLVSSSLPGGKWGEDQTFRRKLAEITAPSVHELYVVVGSFKPAALFSVTLSIKVIPVSYALPLVGQNVPGPFEPRYGIPIV